MPRSILVLLFLFVSTSLLTSQLRTADQRESDRHDSFGRRLDSMIDGFIDGVKRELTGHAETDTIPPAGGERDRANEDIDQWRNTGSITFDGDKTVEDEETIQANVVVRGGDLVVYGKVDGDVLVVGGTLFVRNGGRITGNARVINGEIEKEEDGVIEGYSDRTSASTTGYRYDRGRFDRSGYRFYAPWTDELTNLDNMIYRFNRVEGHFFGLGSEKKYYWDGSRSISPYGFVGWGFKSHRWRYALGLDRQFSLAGMDSDEGHILEFGIQGHSLTDSKEDWIIQTNENTAASVFIHEDFHDYFGREGIALHTAYYFQDNDTRAQLHIEYAADRYSSLERRTEWSIFGGDKVFRVNPPVNEGRMRSILVKPAFSTVERTSRGQEGWNIQAVAEVANKNLGGEFSFSTLVADLRRFQPLGRYDNLNLRLRVGTSGGRVPVQKDFEIGGLGTLHARPYKSEQGNRMILLNAEYIVNGDFLNDLDFWPSWILSRINFIVMADAGFMRAAAPEQGWTDGFEGIRLSDFKNDLGIGFSNRSGSVRAGFAWRTDVKAPARFFFRFTRPF
jgi:hypothetical protein